MGFGLERRGAHQLKRLRAERLRPGILQEGRRGLLLPRRPKPGLDCLAAAVLLLLGTALRNSWAIAVTVVSAES